MALSGLVSYGSSGESGSEDEASDSPPVILPKSVNGDDKNLHLRKTTTVIVKSGIEPARADDATITIVGPQMAPGLSKRQSDPEVTDSTSRLSSSIKKGLSALPRAIDPKALDEFEDDVEEEFKNLPKNVNLPKPPKPKSRAKISLPELPSYDSDEDEPRVKKAKVSNPGKSGLLSSLPRPAHAPIEKSTSLVPRTVNKPAKSVPDRTVRKSAKQTTSTISSYADSDSDDENEGSSFFTFQKKNVEIKSQPRPCVMSAPVVAGPALEAHLGGPSTAALDRLQQPGPSVHPGPSYSTHTAGHNESMDTSGYDPNPGWSNFEPTTHDNTTDPSAQSQIDFNTHQKLIQDEQFKRMVGKGFRDDALMNIMEVNAGDQHASQAEISRSITEEKQTVSYSKKNKDAPSSQSRRKHQITYLAFQAKERELDLKNQWAQNKTTKRQAQAKYGF